MKCCVFDMDLLSKFEEKMSQNFNVFKQEIDQNNKS